MGDNKTYYVKYLDVAKLLKNKMIEIKNPATDSLVEYLGRTAISRAYEAVFLQVYYFIDKNLNTKYSDMKRLAKEYFTEKGIKISLNKHTVLGACIAVNYGEFYGHVYEQLRKARNDVDYNVELQYVDKDLILKEVDEYIKRAEIILEEVCRGENN
ncbi:hypothetical protein [Persephonella sp.]